MRKEFIFILLLFFYSCAGTSLKKGETVEYTFYDGESQSIQGLTIRCIDFKEVFIESYNEDLKKNIHSSYPVFHLQLKEKNESKTIQDVRYGDKINFSNFELKVTWVVVGTRDFKSHAKIKILRK